MFTKNLLQRMKCKFRLTYLQFSIIDEVKMHRFRVTYFTKYKITKKYDYRMSMLGIIRNKT